MKAPRAERPEPRSPETRARASSGVALVPPRYGIDFVDSAAPVQRMMAQNPVTTSQKGGENRNLSKDEESDKDSDEESDKDRDEDETSPAPWLSDRFVRATFPETQLALKNAVIVYDGIGKNLAEGKKFQREAEEWLDIHDGIATISFKDLMTLAPSATLKLAIQASIASHVQKGLPLNVVVLGHGNAHGHVHQVMRDTSRKALELEGGLLREFLGRLGEMTGGLPIGSLLLHGCGTFRTAQEIDAMMPGGNGPRPIGAVFSPEQLQLGIGISGHVRRYAADLGASYSQEQARTWNRHHYVTTLKENRIGLLEKPPETKPGLMANTLALMWSWMGTSSAPTPAETQQPKPSEPVVAHRLVNKIFDAELSFDAAWKLTGGRYRDERFGPDDDLYAAIQRWIGALRAATEKAYGATEDTAGNRVSWAPERVAEIMKELGFF